MRITICAWISVSELRPRHMYMYCPTRRSYHRLPSFFGCPSQFGLPIEVGQRFGQSVRCKNCERVSGIRFFFCFFVIFVSLFVPRRACWRLLEYPNLLIASNLSRSIRFFDRHNFFVSTLPQHVPVFLLPFWPVSLLVVPGQRLVQFVCAILNSPQESERRVLISPRSSFNLVHFRFLCAHRDIWLLPSSGRKNLSPSLLLHNDRNILGELVCPSVD